MPTEGGNEKFQAILFDMDGTLIDSEPLWLEAEQETMAPQGYNWTLSDQEHCLGGPMMRMANYMVEKSTGEKDPEFFVKTVVAIMEVKMASSAKFTEGAAQLLERVKQYPMALVSASSRSLVDAALSRIAPHPFAISISYNDVSEPKPSPEGYLKAAELLGVDVTQCLILEDSLTGVTAARASGAFTVAIPHLVKIEEDARTKTISSLHQLTDAKIDEFYQLHLTSYGQGR